MTTHKLTDFVTPPLGKLYVPATLTTLPLRCDLRARSHPTSGERFTELVIHLPFGSLPAALVAAPRTPEVLESSWLAYHNKSP
jgi:hypothetical protein